VPSEDTNKALARRFLEAFANGDLTTLDELLAPEFINHSLLPGQDPGREGYIQMAAEKYSAFSDIRHIVEYQATDGEEMVITRHTTHRIHDRGASLGMRPTGREWTLTHIDIHRISGGKVLEEWSASSARPILEALAQETRERVEQGLSVARRIQQASLPKEVPTLEEWQIAPYYQPAREIPLPRTTVNRVGSRGRPRGSLLYVLALAISRNCQVVEGGVAQGPFGPGEAPHRAYHLCKQLRERLCLLRTHVLIGHVEHQPAIRL
jgi:predicted ester cyclase